jgi:hypothetical protein
METSLLPAAHYSPTIDRPYGPQQRSALGVPRTASSRGGATLRFRLTQEKSLSMGNVGNKYAKTALPGFKTPIFPRIPCNSAAEKLLEKSLGKADGTHL